MHIARNRFTIHSRKYNEIHIGKNKLINFCHNDYLGLASDERVQKSLIDGVKQYGVGSTSSPFISGFYKSHRMLEERFAEFLQREKAIIFGSGYLANIGVIRALVNKSDNILADKLCHTSILDGMKLTFTKYQRYRHNDLTHLQYCINQCKKKTVVITESIFSMEGCISPIDQISKMTKTQDILLVDDAHGIGFLGKKGRGITEHFNLTTQEVPCLVVPLGKAFASMGAIVAGDRALIENIMQISKSYCYSTALPPAIAFATLTTLKMIEQENWRREKLKSLIQFFIKYASKYNLPLVSYDLTPIKSILVGDNDLGLKIQSELLKKGFFISFIRPPTVPRGAMRIRISLNCFHTEEEILKLLDLITETYQIYKPLN